MPGHPELSMSSADLCPRGLGEEASCLWRRGGRGLEGGQGAAGGGTGQSVWQSHGLRVGSVCSPAEGLLTALGRAESETPSQAPPT